MGKNIAPLDFFPTKSTSIEIELNFEKFII